MTNLAQYKKTIVAVIGAALAWGYTAQVDGIDSTEWWGLAIAVATAAGVYQARNTAPLRRDDDGFVDAGSLALGIIVGLTAGWFFWGS